MLALSCRHILSRWYQMLLLQQQEPSSEHLRRQVFLHLLHIRQLFIQPVHPYIRSLWRNPFGSSHLYLSDSLENQGTDMPSAILKGAVERNASEKHAS